MKTTPAKYGSCGMNKVTQTIYPRLGNNETVIIAEVRYRAEFWQSSTTNYYEFINVSDRDVPDFTRTEQQVSDAITANKIKRF